MDEQEGGPNVYTFNYGGFQGQGKVDNAADNDVWSVSAAPGVAGDFALTVALAPGATASVQLGATNIVFNCPSSATANCLFGPAQDSRLRFTVATNPSVSITYQSFFFAGSPISYGLQIANVPVCGNGIVDNTEQCDDGNTSNGDACSATCTIEVPAQCTPITAASYTGLYSSNQDMDVMVRRAIFAGYEGTLVSPMQCDLGSGVVVQRAFFVKRGIANPVMLQSRSDLAAPMNHVILEVTSTEHSVWVGGGQGKMVYSNSNPSADAVIYDDNGHVIPAGCEGPSAPQGTCKDRMNGWFCEAKRSSGGACETACDVVSGGCAVGCFVGTGGVGGLFCYGGCMTVYFQCMQLACGAPPVPYEAACCTPNGCHAGACRYPVNNIFECSQTLPPQPCDCPGSCSVCQTSDGACIDVTTIGTPTKVVVSPESADAYSCLQGNFPGACNGCTASAACYFQYFMCNNDGNAIRECGNPTNPNLGQTGLQCGFACSHENCSMERAFDLCWAEAVDECNIPAAYPQPNVDFPLTPGVHWVGMPESMGLACCD